MHGPRGKRPFSFFGSSNSVLCMGQGANNHFHVLVVLARFRCGDLGDLGLEAKTKTNNTEQQLT